MLPGIGELENGRGEEFVAVHGGIGRAMEERVELIEFLLRNRIKLVVVADGTLRGETEPGVDRGGGAVDGVAEDVFGLDRAAFGRRDVAAVEAAGDHLLARGIGEEIAGELFDGELIEGQVAIVSVDDPVSVGPHRALIVQVQAVSVAVARLVEPVVRHVLAVMRRGEQARDDLVVSVGRLIGDEGIDFRGRRRETGEVEGDAPEECFAVGLRGAGEPFLLQALVDEGVDRIGDWRLAIANCWHCRLHRHFEGPVLLIRSPLLDPFADGGLLLGGQRLVRLRGRHHVILVVADDPLPGLALRQITRLDRHVAVLVWLERAFDDVEPELGLALFGVDPVTGEALVGKNWPDVAVELELLRVGGHRLFESGKNDDCRQHSCRVILGKEGTAKTHGQRMAQGYALEVASISRITFASQLRKYVTASYDCK